MPTLFKDWDQSPDSELSAKDIQRMYESGFAGAKHSAAEHAAWKATIQNSGGVLTAEKAADSNGWAGSHEGQLVAPWVFVEKAYQGCWPGPAQTVGDCVSQAGKNARLLALVLEVIAGQPDEVSGKIETLPEVNAEGIAQGVLATESAYWFRGHSGHGWYCAADAAVAMREAGCVVRQNYPDIGVDLSRYSGRTASKWGRSKPPAEVRNAIDDNLVRQTTEVSAFEEIRDLLGNGYGVSSCGSEGFSSTRDASGVSRRQGSWAHAMAVIGADDRPETRRKYGQPLLCILNSWGRWNSGPRDVMDSPLKIPEGAFWAKWSDVRRRSYHAYSAVNGWPARNLPDYLGGW